MTDTRTAPISSHPAFRWGVGAWFALLLGLGLFVMPAAVHQTLGERLGIAGSLGADSLRLALSGAAALLGFVIGLVLAMRVASLNPPKDKDAADEGADEADAIWLSDDDADESAAPLEDEPRRPFNPREDMEEEGIGVAREEAEEPEAIDEDSALMELWREEMGDDADLPTPPAPTPEPLEEPVDAEYEPVVEVDESFDDDPVSGSEGFEDSLPTLAADEPLAEAEPPTPETDEEASDPSLEFEPEPADAHAPEPSAPEALGDLSLDALTERLASALEAARAAPESRSAETDPVIAFLRREAERDVPQTQRSEVGEDPQAELRSALDKLTRVGTPK